MPATVEHPRTQLSGIRWRDDGWAMGHERYCADPSHSPLEYCSAGEPGRRVSEAYLRDHPARLTRVAAGEYCWTDTGGVEWSVSRVNFGHGPEWLVQNGAGVALDPLPTLLRVREALAALAAQAEEGR